MYKVLLPVDHDMNRSQNAVDTIISLPISEKKTKVIILNVEPELDVSDADGRVKSEEWYDAEEVPNSAIEASNELENVGFSVKVERRHGEPSEEILKFADSNSIDHIMMGGRKNTPVGKVLFGSVTQSILLNSNIPVTVVTGS